MRRGGRTHSPLLASGSLPSKLGSADKARIQQHMDALRDIERTLTGGNGAAGF